MLLGAACVLLLLGLWLMAGSRRDRAGMGLPDGQVLTQDHVDQSMPTVMLRSERHGIQGRPDCLIRTAEGIVPVELKRKARPPARGGVYPNHMIQVLAYALLVMEHYGEPVPCALVLYGGGQARKVLLTEENLLWVESTVEEIRKAHGGVDLARSHQQPGRCFGCGVREGCTQSLAGAGQHNRIG